MTFARTERFLRPEGSAYRALVTFTGIVAAFTMVLSGTIVNVAVPDVMGAFGVGQDKAQFLSTAYIATMTASQLLNAWVISVFGRRLAFSLVLTIFVIGSLVCTASPNIDLVIVGRVMQGFAAGIVQPLVLITIIGVFPKDRRGTATGVYISGLALALGFGPAVGGITIDALNWRWIFLVPLPFVGTSLLLGTFFIPDDADARSKAAFDWWGYSFLCIALYCLMSAVANGQREGWDSDLILSYWLIGAGAAIAFVRSQTRDSGKLLDFSLFSNPRFMVVIFLTFVFGVGNFAITYAIPVFGQLVLGLTPTAAGLLLLPAGIIAMLVTLVVGRISDHLSTVTLIMVGLGMFFFGTLLLAQGDVNTPVLTILLLTIACRIGTAFVGPAATATAIDELPSDRLNEGSGTINFFRQMGGAFGINILVAMLERRTEFHVDAMTATQNADNEATRQLLRGATELLSPSGLPAAAQSQIALDHLGQMLSMQANTLAWRDGFLMVSAVFLFAMLPAWFLRRTGSRRKV